MNAHRVLDLSQPILIDPFAVAARADVATPSTVVVLGHPGGGPAGTGKARTVVQPLPERPGRLAIVVDSAPALGAAEYVERARALEEEVSS